MAVTMSPPAARRPATLTPKASRMRVPISAHRARVIPTAMAERHASARCDFASLGERSAR